MEFRTFFLTVVVPIVLVVSAVQESESRPSTSRGDADTIRATVGQQNRSTYDRYAYMNNFHMDRFEQCDSEPAVEALCRRCSKVTKSKLAYPMCCQNMESARAWCRQLYYVGR